MAKQTINQGTAPTGAGGDTFRSGSAKLQANDDELYAAFGASGGVLPAALPITKGGTGATTVAAARTNLGLGTAATLDVVSHDTDASNNTNLMRVGTFGVGNPIYLDNKNNMNSYFLNAQFYSTTSPTNGWVNGIFQTFKGNVNRFAQIGFKEDNNSMLVRTGLNIANGGAWATVRTTSNTTVDANGFIKNASPIVQLFADKIELNYEAQQQNIEFEKLGVGDYLIKGSTGFAQEGWYIETPKDANGNVLFSVIYATLENGDISVKTYKKKFDIETASIVADLENPVDIAENRWIDLRLQELPQPEIEMPGSIAPPDFQPTGLAQAVATVMESYHGPEQ